MGYSATVIEQRTQRTVLPSRAPGVIRLAVVGLGPRSYNILKGGPVYDEYEVVAACDVRPPLVERALEVMADTMKSPIRGYTDVDTMLAKEELDAAAVMIPSTEQIPMVCKLLEAGLHVMCEVPLCTSLEHCWDVVTTVERTGKVFLLMEQLRYSGIARGWHRLVQNGTIGKPIFAEGEYFDHKIDFWFQDADGTFYSPEQAKRHPGAKPQWRHSMSQICYLPHELSPLLYVLDDRVVNVVGMGTRPGSYRFDNVTQSDIQVALMHTAKDTLMRMAVCYTSPAIKRGLLTSHWWHIKGTEGVLELPRSEKDRSKMFVQKWETNGPVEMPWDTLPPSAPEPARATGHGGLDFYPLAHFADAVLRDVPLEFDVYRAAETAAPAALAAESIADGGRPRAVPDFRPGPHRKAGHKPSADA